jgi:hypothetical protein
MATLKIYTRQDKAAFLNHLGKYDIQINSDDIEDIKKDNKNKSYFLVHNLDDNTIDKIKELFSTEDHPDMDITVLKEIVRKVIRAKYQERLGSAKKFR